MAEAKDSGNYLGIVVAEQALSTFFDHIERMPNGTPGYDFVCGKGFKIDVKSACNYHRYGKYGDKKYEYDRWQFGIGKNRSADYFLCLAFDSRETLEPCHVWLIPGNAVNHLTCICISRALKSIKKWSPYEKSLDKVITGCDSMRMQNDRKKSKPSAQEQKA